MKVKAHVLQHNTLVVETPREVPRALLQEIAEDLAEQVEQRIAEDFQNERGAGKALRGYSDEHEQRKAREGLLLEKGHMTGALQDELDRGDFARIAVHPGRITIKWNEDDLIARAPHAEYYAAAKVSNGRLLYLLRKDADMAVKWVREQLAQLQPEPQPFGRGLRGSVSSTRQNLGTRVRVGL